MTRRPSRRDMLRLAGGAAALPLLGGCAGLPSGGAKTETESVLRPQAIGAGADTGSQVYKGLAGQARDPARPEDRGMGLQVVSPGPADHGWKDVIDGDSGGHIDALAKFGSYQGKYVFHCHNLEHEDMAMMDSFQVV